MNVPVGAPLKFESPISVGDIVTAWLPLPPNRSRTFSPCRLEYWMARAEIVDEVRDILAEIVQHPAWLELKSAVEAFTYVQVGQLVSELLAGAGPSETTNSQTK